MKIWKIIKVIDWKKETGDCVYVYTNYLEAAEMAKFLNREPNETYIVIAEWKEN